MNPTRVLFVDDEASILDAYRRLLSEGFEDIEATFVTDPREALALCLQQRIDVLVSDVAMPYLSGLRLLAELDAARVLDRMAVVMVTGLDDHQLKAQALDLGASDLLTKPCSPSELRARLRSAIRLQAATRRSRQEQRWLLDGLAQHQERRTGADRDALVRLERVCAMHRSARSEPPRRVGELASWLARAIGLDREFVGDLELAAPLHDLGMLAVPERILSKAGRLEVSERAELRHHCVRGEEVLGHGQANVDGLGLACSICRHHHEWWNGSGYPDGLAGRAIPIEARLVAVADVYDALTSVRPFRAALSPTAALDVMSAEAEDHFDPTIYAVLQRYVASLEDLAPAGSAWPEAPEARR